MPLRDRRERRVVVGDPLELSAGRGEQSQNVGALVRGLRRQQVVRLGCREPQVLEVGEPIRSLGQLAIFAAERVRRLDLGHRHAQLVGLARSAVALGDEHVELALVGLPAAVDRLILVEHRT